MTIIHQVSEDTNEHGFNVHYSREFVLHNNDVIETFYRNGQIVQNSMYKFGSDYMHKRLLEAGFYNETK